jgi:hypothetical protein
MRALRACNWHLAIRDLADVHSSLPCHLTWHRDHPHCWASVQQSCQKSPVRTCPCSICCLVLMGAVPWQVWVWHINVNAATHDSHVSSCMLCKWFLATPAPEKPGLVQEPVAPKFQHQALHPAHNIYMCSKCKHALPVCATCVKHRALCQWAGAPKRFSLTTVGGS